MGTRLEANIERFSGFADRYNDCRPQPPAVIIDILSQLACISEPRLVVDIGSGTGLSTRIWSDRAHEVVGVEPNPDMRAEAEQATEEEGLRNVRFLDGISTRTGLDDECADIVTCSQALHWMEPEGTFKEVARILRNGGVFAAIDCDWPPVINWEVEEAYNALMDSASQSQKRLGITEEISRWPKSGHLNRMQESGCFRYVREVFVHKVESGDVDRLLGLVLSFGGVASLLKRGMTEHEVGLDSLREVAERVFAGRTLPWYYGYRIRLGVK